MHVLVKKRTSGQIEFGIIYGGIALLALWAARSLPVLTFLPSCTFKGLTGLPCPTCGSTRSLVHLSHGDVADALAMNPLITLCFLCLFLYALYSLVTLLHRMDRINMILSEHEKNILHAGAFMIILLNWTYLIFTQ